MVQSLARGIEILSIIEERGSATIVEVASVLGGAGLSGRTVGVKHGTGGTGQAERTAVQAVEQAAVQAFRSNEESGRTKKDILTKEAKFK